jgi:LSD1 subclass zinc finger protein
LISSLATRAVPLLDLPSISKVKCATCNMVTSLMILDTGVGNPHGIMQLCSESFST